MRAIGQLSFLMLIIASFVLICVIAFSGDDFWKRHDWRSKTSVGQHDPPSGEGAALSHIDLGRLFCVWLYRCWWLLAILTITYLVGGKYAA